jgi:hypothetical protein
VPSILGRSPKVDPNALYIVVDSHVSAGGLYKEGQTVRGDDPGLRANPHLFILDPATEAEIHAARAALYARANTSVATPDATPPITSDGTPIVIAQPIPPERQLRCIREFVLPGTARGGRRIFKVGQVYDARDPNVKKFKQHFEKVALATDS